ncbi:hypothetical protein ACFVVU_25280 [Kitasatospora sp. NPDC057965]|uniref:hypothetical protein n=1 Tax=Kitasatospora sp. NPDC057965 TaxID=3346291 RepID=UPI0036DBF1EC
MTEDDLERLLAFLPAPKRGEPRNPEPPMIGHQEVVSAATASTVPGSGPTLNVGNAGIAALHIGTLVQKVRGDLLPARELIREEILGSPTFTDPAAWNDARNQGWAALADPDIRVVIIVSPRGFGSTTFAHRLLATRTPQSMTLVQLEPEWQDPKVEKLRLDSSHAYQLDLKDPEKGSPSRDFLSDLAKKVEKLKAAGSIWVLTVATELWASHWAWSAPGVQVIALRSPPEPQAVVEKALAAAGHPWLIEYVRTPTAHTQLSAVRDAVQAVQAASSVIDQWREYQYERPLQARVVAAGAGRPPGGGLDAELRQRIENALGDWRAELDETFAGGGAGKTLSLEDRCLLLSLAVHRRAPAAVISKDARLLEKLIAEADRTTTPTNLGQAFAGRGLRQRLTGLRAEVNSQDVVDFHRPGFDRAVLGYVWDNYEDMRPVLLRWLVKITPPSNRPSDLGVASLTALAVRHQSPAVLTDIRETAVRLGRTDVCVAVMCRALLTEQMEWAVWARLYDWADHRADTQFLVVAVADRVLADPKSTPTARGKALTRLRRVASNAQNASVLREVLTTYRQLAANEAGRDQLLDEVLWKPEGKPSPPGKIALLALATSQEAADPPLPWLLRIDDGQRRAAVDDGLRELLSDAAFEAEAVEAIARWLQAAAGDIPAYRVVLDRAVPLLRGRPSRTAGVHLMRSIEGLVLPDGSSVGDDVWDALSATA